MSLKQIFDSITPENIKNIPLIETAMSIFIENLEKNSDISIDLHKIYDNSETDSVTEDSKTNLKTALLNIYLSELFKTLQNAQVNNSVIQRYNNLSITDIPLEEKAHQVLNSEYFHSNKIFKENVGTEKGIKYAYDLAKYLEGDTDEESISIEKVKPFHLRIDGTITEEIYRNMVAHLSHPIGFTYAYTKIITESLSDLFGLDVSYIIEDIEIRGLNDTFDVFTADSDDTNIEAKFIARGYTAQEYADAITASDIVLHLNKVVQEIIEESGISRTVIFTDDTVIRQTLDPIQVTYRDGNEVDIKIFNGHFSLYLNYTTELNINYTDTIEFVDTQFMNDIFDITNDAIVQDDFIPVINSLTGSYTTTSDTLYLVSDDGLTPGSQFYFTTG